MNKKKSIEDDYEMRLNTITKYIDEHLNENLDLKKLSKMSNFSDYHFHRIFKEHYHETLAAYISRNRVERAAYLLRYTNSPIKDIAYNVGFEFPSSLSKSFKELYNVSPSGYRQNKTLPGTENRVIRKETAPIADVTYSGFVMLKNEDIIYSRLMGPYKVSRYTDVWRRLLKYAEEHNANKSEPDFIIMYHNDSNITETSKLRSDVCITVNKIIPANGKIGVKKIVGGKYAVFSYIGPYLSHSAIFNAIFEKWELNDRFELRNLPIFEKYLNNPMKTKPGPLNTEIYLPIQ
jgi:AraC family transcriptional regulator